MLIRNAPDIPSSEITPESVYLNRRAFLRTVPGVALASAALVGCESRAEAEEMELGDATVDQDALRRELTRYEDITTYNNFYEFGLGKDDPAKNAHTLRTRPWTVTIDGHVARPARYEFDDLVRPFTLQERIYRFRCVEAWSMVIPWMGFPLRDLIERVEPTSRARFVTFTTLHDPEQMPGQRRPVLEWPYREGLRMDEAMHPLTLLATGLYGRDLPNQNGAPLRLVVPWKYGFKYAKSIVRISFVEELPPTTWAMMKPDEYGFYANVNPEVDHPRWSQRTERRIGELRRRPTLPFNGYGEQVARLYAGMDPRTLY